MKAGKHIDILHMYIHRNYLHIIHIYIVHNNKVCIAQLFLQIKKYSYLLFISTVT